MTTTLAPGRAQAAAGRTMFAALAAREMRRFVINPVFLFAVLILALPGWAGRGSKTPEIDTVNEYPAIFLGGFGMMATFWLTRSMRATEPVIGVTPTTQPVRTAALCTVAIVPFGLGCLALLEFLHYHPVSDPRWGVQHVSADGRPRRADRRPHARRPAARGSRWAAGCGPLVPRSVLFLILYGWISLVTILSFPHASANSALVTVLRLFAPFAFFTYTEDSGSLTTWRGSPWFFLGWQLALCAIAVLVAILRGAEDGRAS